ncbi:MAG: peptidase M64 [Planctomycetes bacterium]|nr:peptidase M64 [Planctomycetota bacterium]
MRTLVLLWGLALMPAASGGEYDQDFTGATLRLDLFHTGHAELELISVDAIRVEGPWPCSRTRLLDDRNLGQYFFEVKDAASGQPLYSRGFASIYGEWETTGEALAKTTRTFAEALRFPEPRRPFKVRLAKRDARLAFQDVWTSAEIDPASRFVLRANVAEREVLVLNLGGEPAEKVDLLFLGDGYTEAEKHKFHEDCRRLRDELFQVEPFRSRVKDFNVRAVFTPAAESGISDPRAGVFRDSPLGTTYNSLDSDRYVLTLEDRAWRDAAAAAPYEFVVILLNSRKYGGGGIFDLYCTAAADSAYAAYLVIHEFGHHLAGLGDEYYTSDVAYEELTPPDVEPWEPNVTALLDPASLKWKDLVTEGAALPTAWEQDRYGESARASEARRAELRAKGAPEEEMEALFREEQKVLGEILGAHKGTVGAFQGAMYRAQGLYRPCADCIMFSRTDAGFCPVCSRAITRAIDACAAH